MVPSISNKEEINLDITPKQICPLVSWHGLKYRLTEPIGKDIVQLASTGLDRDEIRAEAHKHAKKLDQGGATQLMSKPRMMAKFMKAIQS